MAKDKVRGSREYKYRVDHSLTSVDTFIKASKYETKGNIVTFFEKDAHGSYLPFLSIPSNSIYKIERVKD